MHLSLDIVLSALQLANVKQINFLFWMLRTQNDKGRDINPSFKNLFRGRL
jgi:hypothetical protein